MSKTKEKIYNIGGVMMSVGADCAPGKRLFCGFCDGLICATEPAEEPSLPGGVVPGKVAVGTVFDDPLSVRQGPANAETEAAKFWWDKVVKAQGSDG